MQTGQSSVNPVFIKKAKGRSQVLEVVKMMIKGSITDHVQALETYYPMMPFLKFAKILPSEILRHLLTMPNMYE